MRVFIYDKNMEHRIKITLAKFLENKTMWFRCEGKARSLAKILNGVLLKKARIHEIKRWGVFLGSELNNFWSG